MEIQKLLETSTRKHSHLCPRQILGVRIGLAGLAALGFTLDDVTRKQMLVISETDGCFIDGVIAATNCEFGHRTLRVEDYGKIAATFIDTKTERAYRIVPALDVRQKAFAYAPNELRRYFAQLQAYQVMPEDELLTIQEVILNQPVCQIVSQPGRRVNCDQCGEEIINEREIKRGELNLCRACAGITYYQLAREASVLRLAPVMPPA